MDGLILRELREKKGESRFAMAVATNTTPQTIYAIEAGVTKNPGVTLMRDIAEHLGVSIEELIGSGDEKQIKEG